MKLIMAKSKLAGIISTEENRLSLNKGEAIAIASLTLLNSENTVSLNLSFSRNIKDSEMEEIFP